MARRKMTISPDQIVARMLLDSAAPRMNAALDNADASIVHALAMVAAGAYKILPGNRCMPDNVLVHEAEQELLKTESVMRAIRGITRQLAKEACYCERMTIEGDAKMDAMLVK